VTRLASKLSRLGLAGAAATLFFLLGVRWWGSLHMTSSWARPGLPLELEDLIPLWLLLTLLVAMSHGLSHSFHEIMGGCGWLWGVAAGTCVGLGYAVALLLALGTPPGRLFHILGSRGTELALWVAPVAVGTVLAGGYMRSPGDRAA